jgi:hypothetical protein
VYSEPQLKTPLAARPAGNALRPDCLLMSANEAPERRRAQLIVALGFARLAPRADMPELEPLRRWLDSWPGIGAIAAGMARQSFDLQLTSYGGEVWRANFFPAGLAHSIVAGSGWAPTPWRAVQDAAWQALQYGPAT